MKKCSMPLSEPLVDLRFEEVDVSAGRVGIVKYGAVDQDKKANLRKKIGKNLGMEESRNEPKRKEKKKRKGKRKNKR